MAESPGDESVGANQQAEAADTIEAAFQESKLAVHG
jgi:hypothetical protein